MSSIKVLLLPDSLHDDYDCFLKQSPAGLLYHSTFYRNLITSVLVQSKSFYLIAMKGSKIVGAFTFWIKYSTYGNIANSNPFYGSHGGLVVHPSTEDSENICESLLIEYQRIMAEENVVSSTTITNPFYYQLDFYYEHESRLVDERIGQFIDLTKISKTDDKSVMDILHSKTRNMVRKAQNSGAEVIIQNDESSMSFLFETHEMNMAKIGGKAKSVVFFKQILKQGKPGVDYDIFIAKYKGINTSALLVLYFGGYIEYFTPVIIDEYREMQSLSLIIFEVLKQKGGSFKVWNWGGTWKDQGGVYLFKKRWGTDERPYRYYSRSTDDRFKKLTKDQLLKEYSNFYVLPFSELNS